MRILGRTGLALAAAAMTFIGLPAASASAPTAASVAELDGCGDPRPVVARKAFKFGGKRIGVAYVSMSSSTPELDYPGACLWFLPDRKYRKVHGTSTLRFDFAAPGETSGVVGATTSFNMWREGGVGMANSRAVSGWVATGKVTVRYRGRKQKAILTPVLP